MIGNTVSHYKIVEQIGEGGMGIVYKAEDTKLGRTVALKFLQNKGLGDKDQRDRFVREARTVATLNHPNICTVHEIDESDGDIFIAMEYVDGTNLLDILRDHPMDSDEVARIGVQVSSGLEAAHKNGVVHRDIKSANIMMTADGRPIIMDFGLATAKGSATITGSDTVVGTLAYMSPEQLRGDPVDERTDIWSLGTCLYEMLSGRLPFVAEYETALGYAILNEDAPPLSELRPGLPFTLGLVIETALSKDAEKRYPNMSAMRTDLESAVAESAGTLSPTTNVTGRAPTSIAVLPFSDMSRKKDQDYFCDGITEEIINDLAQLGMLRVVSRTSSFAFKDKHEDVRIIGRRLGVKCVLEGSVRKAGNHIRITAQLIDVANGYHLWSDQYDTEMEEIFAIQEEIAESIVKALEIELSEREKRAIQKPAARDVDAYDFYLRGRKLFYQTRRSNIARAREMFSKAIKEDSKFASAHAGMANCYSYLYWYFDRKSENIEGAMAASQKALELDPDLAEAHAARGLALTLNEQYKDAESEYKEAVRLNPALFEAYYFHARTRFVQGDMEGAARLFERACAVDPEDYQAPMMLGFVLTSLKQMDKASAVYQRGLDNVDKHLALNSEDSRAFYLASSALIGLGRKEKGLKYSMRAVSLDPDDSYILYGVACNFARLGEIDESIYYFERALRSGFAHKQWIENDADLDPIKSDPRYHALLAELKD
jgi:serine/threonine protein kinase/Tfp pilus assembly protein PilF